MSGLQKISLYGMALFYIGGGINHFIHPEFYIGIMPDFFPVKELLNKLSGVAEIFFGILLLFPSTRKSATYLIILMLVAFFSVHITHLFHPPAAAAGYYWVIVLRIPLQFLLIWWAYKVSRA
jgi:uncharacterized membrane protein